MVTVQDLDEALGLTDHEFTDLGEKPPDSTFVVFALVASIVMASIVLLRRKAVWQLQDPEDSKAAQADTACDERVKINPNRSKAKAPHVLTMAGCHPYRIISVFEHAEPKAPSVFILNSDEHSVEPCNIETGWQCRGEYRRLDAPSWRIVSQILVECCCPGKLTLYR